MKKILLFSAFLLLSNCFAQNFDPQWSARFQTVLDSVIVSNNIKGASMAVYNLEEGLWSGVSGVSSSGIPVTADMRFGVGSSTKLFMATIILKLQEQGILSLDDHIYQWLPQYPNIDSTATIRQLLSHQSGFFCYILDNPSIYSDSIWTDTTRFWTPQEILETIGPPHFSPGKGYYYSNTNYLLASMIIETATGKTWVQNLHEIILDPLDMDSTFVGAFENPNGPVAHEWANDSTEIVNSPMTSLFSMSGASGGIMSTVFEMIQWYRALFEGNILSDSSLKQIKEYDPSSNYGLGICVGLHSKTMRDIDYFHAGEVLGYQSLMYYNSMTGSILCYLANSLCQDFEYVYDPLLDVLNNEYPKKQNDAGIVDIVYPWQNICNAAITPSIILKNFGSDPLNNVTINYQIDSGPAYFYNWAGTLDPDSSSTESLPAISATSGFHEFICYTSSPNGASEGYNYNDTSNSRFIINLSGGSGNHIWESFEGSVFPPTGWVKNSNTFFHWGLTSLASSYGNFSAVKCNYLDYNAGSICDLDLPMIDFSFFWVPYLQFDYAYTHYPGYYDTLHVLISYDCGLNWQTLFYSGGDSLMTAPPTEDVFYPEASQWMQQLIPIYYWDDVLIRFRVIAGYGNNLYIDNVIVSSFSGINPVNSDRSGISVYPNPAYDKINIKGLLPGSEFYITDLRGKTIMTKESENIITTVDLSHLPKGMYFLITPKGSKKICKI